ncbi:MAG: MarR family transcriptional regulator, partial [Caldilineaceae bacterium]|nr:MarR family transcriptional regulator [Caldilineaceae bacterium]
MSKVARLYHEQELNQSQIAAQLYLSQSTVSRLLKRAQKEQIIRVVIHTPPGTFPEVEAQLLQTYQLKDVIVVDCAHPSDPVREIGAAAAYYVETTLNQREIIGISSWSST